ncbi:MAG: hypothetical protein JNM17_24195 [Archangium sp.]|nr:hypothetical protein [Archangium sp.]
MSSRSTDAIRKLVELSSLRERALALTRSASFQNTFVSSADRHAIPGVEQALDEELEDAWLEVVAALEHDGFPAEALSMSQSQADAAGQSGRQLAAQAQADSSGRRVRYGSSVAMPSRQRVERSDEPQG